MANLLELEQDEVIHYCDKTSIFENCTIVIMRSCFYADLNCLKERFKSNNDEIFNSLVEGGGCQVKKDPITNLFLLGNDDKKTPKEPKPPETKVKKYNI